MPPSGHTSTMLAAGPTGVLLLAGGGGDDGRRDPADANAGTVTGAGLLVQVTRVGGGLLLCVELFDDARCWDRRR